MLVDLIWNVDPVITTLGSLQVRWFTLLFLMGILLGRFLLLRSLERDKLTPAEGNTIFNYSLLGALAGSRLFYFLLFDPKVFISSPLHIVFPFEFKEGFRFVGASEFSSIGGLLGLLISLFILSKVKKKTFPIYFSKGLLVFIATGFFIAIGNFFQSDNYGVPTDSRLGVRFVSRVDKKLMRTPCCVMRIPNGKNPLDRVSIKEGKVLAHEATGYRPIIIYLFFTEGATEQLVNEFLIGDVKTALYELPELVFESGEEPLHYNIYEEGKGKYMARIQSIGIARHPLQLYESFAFLIIGLGLILLEKKENGIKNIAPFLLAAVWGIIHFGFGFLTDSPGIIISGLSVSADQLTCAIVALVLILFGWLYRTKI
jgi:prolipoprotein diacylglyceryltransferase